MPPPHPVIFPYFVRCELVRLLPEKYLEVYSHIGGAVGWDSRFKLSRPDLAKLLAAPESYCFVLYQQDDALGLCEFHLAENGQAELQHFGLSPILHGKGLSLPFLQSALHYVFQAGAKRIWLHTDEWDSPAAQHVYAKVGFTIYDRKFLDPEPL